jgi:pectate lyase
MFLAGCGDDGGDKADATGGASGTTATGGTTSTGGTSGASGAGGTMVPTPPGTLFTDDFEAGANKWDVTQGTCSIMADAETGSNVFNCINGGNEARAVAGESWGEYTLTARIRVNSMDPVGGRRIHLAARFADSNNWYGAAIYDGSPFEVQIRKKVMGTSSEIARTTYDVVLGTWNTLKLEVKGSTLTLTVNDSIQLTATDTQFSAGKIALLVDRSDVSWDDVTVTNP